MEAPTGCAAGASAFQVGEEVFYEFLSWSKGNFRFEPIRKEAPEKQVQRDTVGLLLEGMRRVDELKQTGVWKKPPQ